MLCATLLLALMAQDEAGPLRLEADRPVLVRGVPFRLSVRTDARYTGVVRLKGLRGIDSVAVNAGVGDVRGAIAEGRVEASAPGLRTASLDAPMIPGWLSLVPGLLAVGLALLTRQLLLSLFVGAWAGMLISGGLSVAAPVTSAVRVVDTLLLDVLTRPAYVTVVLFIVLLGGLIGLVVHSGGARGIADRLARRMTKPRAAMLTTWALGVVLIIQDYASALLVGNTMRPLTDRVRISREKLAYLVDSTVAPMAAVGLFSAWALAEMRATDQLPSVFLSIIPYSFYAILALLLAGVVATSERDFGPMLTAERRASNTGLLVRLGGRPLADRDAMETEEVESMRDRWHNAAIPLLGVVLVTVTALFLDGGRSRPEGSWFWEWPAYASPGRAVLWGIIGGTLIAFVTVVARRHLDPRQAVDGWTRGARSVFMPLCILALAWGLAVVSRNLSMGAWIWTVTGVGSAAPWLAPSLIFIAASVAAAASGSSIASTSVLLPLAAALPGDGGVQHAALAAVFSGAIFGRHVSPLGDTTIVASLGSACDHVDHVRTQAPYAALCGGVALLCGFLPAGAGVEPSLCLMLGAGVILAVFFAMARFRGEPTAWAAPATLDMPTQIPLPEEQTMS